MASVKAYFKYLDKKDKIKLKKTTCLFTISVGQQSHENERFESTMQLFNDSFASCIMLVDDTLQRHNMALTRKYDAEYFYEISIKEGDLWFERNKKHYEKCHNLKRIIRWDHWLKHPKYKEQYQKVKTSVETDPVYKAAFDHATDDFLSKYTKRLHLVEKNSYYEPKRARQLCFNFILEECTALTLWPELNCRFEAYPGLHNRAIEETRKRFVKTKNPDMLTHLTIGFRNAGQMTAQKFLLLGDACC